MMKRILNAGIRLFLLTVVFAASPLLAQKNKPAKIKAAALQVEMIESDEIKLPAEFQVALYENLIRQLEKNGFSHVYRDGDRNAASVADLVVLHSTVRGFKAGSERARQVTTVSGATSIAVNRPSRFCEHGPVSTSLASAAHCVGVRLIPISRAKIVAWRCHTWRRMKPICSSRI